MKIPLLIYVIAFVFLDGINALVQAKDDVEIFIAIKQDCSNCNMVAHVYKQVATKYKTRLVFGNMSKKEVKSYLTEVIVLPETTPHIVSDSIMKILDDFSKGLGAFVYAYQGNECVYAANLKSFDMNKMNEAIRFETIKYEKISLPDSITFLNHASSISNSKYYCLYDYTLKKVFVFSLPDYKLENIITDKNFNDEELWRLTFNNTTGLDSARKICTKVKMYIPDSKMIHIDGVSCDKENVYFWISLFEPRFHTILGQRTLSVGYKTAVLVKYDPQKKFTYYRIEPIYDPDNKCPPTELSQNPATYYFDAPFQCTNTCIVDSMLYIGIYKNEKVKDRPNYPMAVYKFGQNQIRFVGFYKKELPKINTFEKFINPFVPVLAGKPVVYFTSSPYYLSIPDSNITVFSFLPKQNLRLSDPKSILWAIVFVSLKDNHTLLCINDKVSERFYIIKLRDNYITEKYRVSFPKFSSDLNMKEEYLVFVDSKKENLIKILLKNL